MADDDVVSGHDAQEVVTVQLLQDMLKKAFEVQRLEMDQRMKEIKDHLAALIKPLENAIRALQRSNLARHAISEAGDLSQVRNQEQELTLHISEPMVTKKPRLIGNFHQGPPKSSFKYSKGRSYPTNAQSSRAPILCNSHGSKSFPRSRPRNTCNRCGKYHKGRCPVSGPVCYRCGESGHMSYGCPQGENFYCPRCGEMGHTSMRCPNRQPQSEERSSVVMPAATSTHATHAASVVPAASRPTLSVLVGAFHDTAEEARNAPKDAIGTLLRKPHRISII